MNEIKIKKRKARREIERRKRQLQRDVKNLVCTQEDAVRALDRYKGDIREKYFGDRCALL